jgi:hypothetical protein
MANIKERGILSKTFGLVVGAYMLVGAGCGAWAEVDGWNDGDTPGADFGRGAVYGAKQLTYFGIEAGTVIVSAAYEAGSVAWDAAFDN